MDHARLIRGGGIAGLVAPVPMLAAAAITVVVGPNLRQYGFPWVSAVAAVLCGVCILAVTAAHAGRWRRPRRVAAVATAAGLLGVAGFFAAIGTEDLISTQVDGTRFLSDEGAIAAVGTLIASVLTLVVVPVGLGILGSAVISARVLDRTGRRAAAALAPSLILAALVTAIADLPWVSAAVVAVFAACWHVLGRSLLRAQPVPTLPRSSPMPETRSTAPPRGVSPHDQRTRRGRHWGRFVRHFVVMLTAMYAGMLALYPAYTFVAGRLGHADPTTALPVPSAGAMALAMTLPMAAWMRHHRHGWRLVAEMSAAMVVPTLVATLLHLAGAVPEQAVTGVAHVTMIPAMLAVMLLRFDEYAGDSTIPTRQQSRSRPWVRAALPSTESSGETS